MAKLGPEFVPVGITVEAMSQMSAALMEQAKEQLAKKKAPPPKEEERGQPDDEGDLEFLQDNGPKGPTRPEDPVKALTKAQARRKRLQRRKETVEKEIKDLE